MNRLSNDQIDMILKNQNQYFQSYVTRPLAYRIDMLRRLRAAIIRFDQEIKLSLWKDLHKSEMEVFVFEISPVLQEIDFHIKKLRKWMKPERVKTPIQFLPSKSFVIPEPRGVSLIISPFNYPFFLLFVPLVGAISSGCCAVLKPSDSTPDLSAVVERLISETFDQKYIAVVPGGPDVSEYLVNRKFDFIFFTGTSKVGKIIMQAASKHLTPLVLELGGKSPCIVDKEANISIAAKRIIWGKTINAGQTCIAPDYLFVHKAVKEELVARMISCLNEMYGPEISESRHYARIVSNESVARLKRLMGAGKIRYGGEINEQERYISPVIIDDVLPEFPVMNEEIFGPVLPIMTFGEIDEAISFVNSREKPLALYYFGDKQKARDVFARTSAGGGCINDTFVHIGNLYLPFGGAGYSGIGRYHGKETFLAFSNQKSIMDSSSFIELPFKYPPYRYEKILKKIL